MTDLVRSRVPSPTRSYAQLRRDIAECGYGILVDALDKTSLKEVSDRLLEQAAAEQRLGLGYFFGDDDTGMPSVPGAHDAGPNQRISNLLNKGKAFRALLKHPLIDESVPVMLGRQYLLSSLSAMIMRKGGVRQVIHADQQMVPFDTPVPLVCNVVWMLVDFTKANGATHVVPGSHLWPRPPLVTEIATERAEAPAGSALVFDGRLWHGAGANTTDTQRPAIFSYYCAPYLRQQENIVVSLRDEVYQSLDDHEKQLVGFDAYKRGMGRIAPALGRTNTNWTDHASGELR
jgi:ectoine hydroxylase-related dioxygenase (phytanoyl-CoA dioxygenase family)